ncbi:MAG: hypothetical protein BGO01_07955 [Armatimonadetes bacterium 55-13]|nr:MAG: hypothetical protein BGO01_07955 [Armatimonadetes bacterium 55-13]
MLAEMPQTKPAGARPPHDGLPPVLVTFSPEPDDRDRDMLVYLRDNVRSLLSKVTEVTIDQVRQYVELISLRRRWVEAEMMVEDMMDSLPAAPLGIEEDPYDLMALGKMQRNFRKEKFEELLRMLDQAQAKLEDRFWEQMWAPRPSS